VDSVAFYPTSTKSGVNIAEWSMLNANVLDFWSATWHEIGANFVFFQLPFVLEGHLEEIGIASYWGLRHFVWESFGNVVFPMSDNCGQIKRSSP